MSDAFGIALGMILLSTFALIAAHAPVRSPYSAAAALLQLVALVVTLRVSGVSRRGLRTVLLVAAVLVIAGVAGFVVGGTQGTAVGIVVWLGLTLATALAILQRLRSFGRVNLQMVLGLLCVYVLLGLTFSYLYLLVEHFDPTAFSVAGQGVSGTTYFSFVTLATVGYGDVAPVASVLRALAVAEAILGQLYLVSVVSLAVSRLGDRGASREV